MKEIDQIDIVILAQEIKRAFNEEKRNQLGRPYHPHKRFNKEEMWEAAAQNCQQLNASAFSYIRACFIYGTQVSGGPFLNQIAGRAGIKWFLQYKKMNPGGNSGDVDDVFKTEIFNILALAVKEAMGAEETAEQSVATGLPYSGPKTAKEYFLDTCWTPLEMMPAWVRVVLAPKDPEILKIFGKKAHAEIRSNPRLLKALRELGCWK